MKEKDEKIMVVDADYQIVRSDGEKSPSLIDTSKYISERDARILKNTTTKVVKTGFYAVLWAVRQVGGLIMEGASGVVSGIDEAAKYESRYDYKHQKRVSEPSKRRKKPIWYIPTKEEEEYERYARMRDG